MPYIAMPIDKGYAIDAHGKRQANALCVRDVIWACAPRYPLRSRLSGDPATWSRDLRGAGLSRMDIDLKTGRVSHVTIVKSSGSAGLDRGSIGAFYKMDFHTRKMVGNDNTYHCPRNMGTCSS